MVEIVKKFVPESKWHIKASYPMIPKFIVVHNTANDATARNEVAYMTRNDNWTSFHYAVDDKEVIQAIPHTRSSWSCGDGAEGEGNRNGISIEICYSKSGGARFDKAVDNAIDLIVQVLKSYGWSVDKVKKHQDFNGKYCPHRILDMGWDKFIERIKSKMSDSWFKDAKGWKYGDKASEWILYKGDWYYMGADGYMIANEWVLYKGDWYVLGKDGVMKKDEWVQGSGGWYYLGVDGAMKANEWVAYKGDWYYMGADGSMVKNDFIKYKGDIYAIGGDGVMLDSGTVKVASSGKLTF